MTPNDTELLDELAARLDAGWDTPSPADAVELEGPPSQARLSVAPSENAQALDAVDADWDAVNPSDPGNQRVHAPPPNPARSGTARSRASKRDRRDAERQRQAHQAQRKAANKQQRKAERQEDARRASDALRTARLAEAERRAAQTAATASRKAAKSPKSRPHEAHPKRVAKQAPRNASLPLAAAIAPSAPAPVVLDRGAKKLLPLIAIAIAVGVSLGFALLRAH